MGKIKGQVLFGNVITTANNSKHYADSSIILQDASKELLLDSVQEVVSIGNHLEENSNVKIGDRVLVNFEYFYSPKDSKLSVPTIEIDDVTYLYLEARHIKYVLGKDETAK